MLVEAWAKTKIFGGSREHVVAMGKVALGHIAFSIVAHGSAVKSVLYDVIGPGQGELQSIRGVDPEAPETRSAGFYCGEEAGEYFLEKSIGNPLSGFGEGAFIGKCFSLKTG